MKILTPKQITSIDRATILSEKISSIELMERAGMKCTIRIMQVVPKDSKVHIFCSTGNNGGDGLVIARLLHQAGYQTHAYILPLKTQTEEFRHNLKRISSTKTTIITNCDNLPNLCPNDTVIDAIFGNGLSRPIKGIIQDCVRHINQASTNVISVDMPTGLFSDQATPKDSTVIKANLVLTFQFPKLALLLPSSKDFISNWEIVDIGLCKNAIAKAPCNYHFMTKDEIKKRYIPRDNQWKHKGNFGHGLFIGGSYGKIGATILTTKSMLKSGAGLVSAYIPECGYTALQSASPEVMVETSGQRFITAITPQTNANVIAIGCGMGTKKETTIAFSQFLKQNKKKLVLDADALNIISQNKDLLHKLPPKSILTPHPKELERLIGKWNNDFEKIAKTKELCQQYDLIILVKGAYSMIVSKENIFFNSTANNALATAGSGDTLTGIITGFIAQGYTPINAMLIAVFLHGRTADIYTLRHPSETFTASDIIRLLPQALTELRE